MNSEVRERGPLLPLIQRRRNVKEVALVILDLIERYGRLSRSGDRRWLVSFEAVFLILKACEETIPNRGGAHCEGELREEEAAAIIDRFEELARDHVDRRKTKSKIRKS